MEKGKIRMLANLIELNKIRSKTFKKILWGNFSKILI